MIDDRRVAVAPGLRELFYEQWLHLSTLVEEWSNDRDCARAMNDELLQAVEHVVNGTNARIRALGGYKEKLREKVRQVLEYTEQQANTLPVALDINQKSFAFDPMVNALFVNREEIRSIFSYSGEMQDFIAAAEASDIKEIYAILSVSRKQKSVFGKSLENGMIVGDVRQESVSFSGHRVLAPCANESAARASLKEILFERIVEYVRAYMSRLTYEQTMGGWNIDPIKNLKNPVLYLEMLSELLGAPQELLRMAERRCRINKMGIMTSATDEPVNEFHLHELSVGSNPPEAFTLIKYPRDEILSSDKLKSYLM